MKNVLKMTICYCLVGQNVSSWQKRKMNLKSCKMLTKYKIKVNFPLLDHGHNPSEAH